jgi:hypothetical protein
MGQRLIGGRGHSLYVGFLAQDSASRSGQALTDAHGDAPRDSVRARIRQWKPGRVCALCMALRGQKQQCGRRCRVEFKAQTLFGAGTSAGRTDRIGKQTGSFSFPGGWFMLRQPTEPGVVLMCEPLCRPLISHWVRDVTFEEGRSQVRKGSIPQVMAALRNQSIGLMRANGHTNIAAACRYHAARPEAASALLGPGRTERPWPPCDCLPRKYYARKTTRLFANGHFWHCSCTTRS